MADWQEMLLYDPQTSGGLLVPVAPEHLQTFVSYCAAHDQPTWVVGEVMEGRGIEVV